MVALAKQVDEGDKARIKAEDLAEDLALQKRAEQDLKHLPGSMDVHVSLLKAIDGFEDEKTRKGAMELLKAKDLSATRGFDTQGHISAMGEDDAKGAEQKLSDLAKKYAAENKVTIEQGYSKVLDTPEGSGLYDQISQ